MQEPDPYLLRQVLNMLECALAPDSNLQKQANEFLEKGKKVKLNITLKGREMQHIGRAKELAQNFIDDTMDYGTGEAMPDRITGRSIVVFILPGADKNKIKKRQEEAKKELENAQDSIK